MDLESRTRMLLSAGLTVLDSAWISTVPDPAGAWRAISGGEVKPTALVDDDGGDYLDIVNERWLFLAKECSLFDRNGSFLISVAGVGAGKLPWARVKIDGKLLLAQKLGICQGEPEFVAMALDGHAICGATTEENGIWLVCRDAKEVFG